uniref:RING-type E3 ubiquitin transferase n=1 Tax=Oryza punctata TaxID=4537 RepID=A0A0E0L9Q0_ORYPU
MEALSPSERVGGGAMVEVAFTSSGSSSATTTAAEAEGASTTVPRRLGGELFVVRDGLPYAGVAPPPPALPQVQATTSGGGGGGKISPAVLFIIVILAVVFFISGLLHLLVRLLMKKQHRRGEGGGGSAAGVSRSAAGDDGGGGDAALQRQLQQLFHLHDSGLDQAFIDALPVFAYREIVVGGGGDGDKEPFDCAVCLCEFDAEDRLRLLPLCGHAFHLHCIDTWLLSNSTCPLCRGVLFVPGLTAENNPMFDFDEGLEEGRLSEDCDYGFGLAGQKATEGMQTPGTEKRVFPVRLGKFKNVGTQGAVEGGIGNANGAILRREEGESSSSSLDARRCFSMGTYQYVLGTSELRVSLQPDRMRNGGGGVTRARPAGLSSVNAEIMEGKKICARNKGESFSVSKIWQWSNLKGKLPTGSDECSEAGSLPWMKRGGIGDTSNISPFPDSGQTTECPSLTQTSGSTIFSSYRRRSDDASWPVSGVVGTDKMDCWSLAIEYSCQDHVRCPFFFCVSVGFH